jgi:hypothetical protein
MGEPVTGPCSALVRAASEHLASVPASSQDVPLRVAILNAMPTLGAARTAAAPLALAATVETGCKVGGLCKHLVLSPCIPCTFAPDPTPTPRPAPSPTATPAPPPGPSPTPTPPPPPGPTPPAPATPSEDLAVYPLVRIDAAEKTWTPDGRLLRRGKAQRIPVCDIDRTNCVSHLLIKEAP